MAGGVRSRKEADELLAAALARGTTHAAAAESLGLSVKTVQRRLGVPAFQALVTALRGRLIDESLGLASAGLKLAVHTLGTITADASVTPGVRVAAAGRLIDAALRIREAVSVEERLARLETLAGVAAKEKGK